MNTGMELMMMFSPTIREIIEMEKKRAVLAEREACAKICHEIQMSKYSHDSGDEYYQGYGEGAKDCWQAIRARK